MARQASAATPGLATDARAVGSIREMKVPSNKRLKLTSAGWQGEAALAAQPQR
jgi:hypothetical protein